MPFLITGFSVYTANDFLIWNTNCHSISRLFLVVKVMPNPEIPDCSPCFKIRTIIGSVLICQICLLCLYFAESISVRASNLNSSNLNVILKLMFLSLFINIYQFFGNFALLSIFPYAYANRRLGLLSIHHRFETCIVL